MHLNCDCFITEIHKDRRHFVGIHNLSAHKISPQNRSCKNTVNRVLKLFRSLRAKDPQAKFSDTAKIVSNYFPLLKGKIKMFHNVAFLMTLFDASNLFFVFSFF